MRHSLMLVGPAGSGKSRLVEVLHDSLSSALPAESALLSHPHREIRMNPKAITTPQVNEPV